MYIYIYFYSFFKLKYFIPLNFVIMRLLITSIAFACLLLVSAFKNYQAPEGGNYGKTGTRETAGLAEPEDEQVATFTMEMQSLKNGKPVKNGLVEITYYLNGDQIAIKPNTDEAQQTIMIFDANTKTMTTLMNKDGEKTGMKMKMPKVKVNSKEVDDMDFNVTATNETKTILGYDCKKYLIESEEFSGHAWVTDEVDLNLERAFTFLDVQKNSKNNVPKFRDIDGFPLETSTKNKKKDESYTMKVTDLKLGTIDETVFNTAGYTITDLSSFMNMGEE